MRFTIDLEKSFRSHKYVKRTGSPGNYKYWYKMPDGSIQAPDDAQSHGKIDHAKRLLLGAHAGTHSMSTQDIARHTGLDHEKVTSAKRNLARAGTTWQGRTFAHHEYENEHLHEALRFGEAEPSGSIWSGTNPVEASPADTEARDRASRPRGRRSSPTTTSGVPGDTPRRRATPPVAEADARARTAVATAERTEARAARRDAEARTAEAARTREMGLLTAEVQSASYGRSIPMTKLSQMKDFARELVENGRTAVEAARQAVDRFAIAVAIPDLTPATPSEQAQEQRAIAATTATEASNREAELIAALREHGISIPHSSEAAAGRTESKRRAAEAARLAERARESSPSAPHAAAVHEASPDLAAADQPIQRMEAAQAAGDNPYISRAKEIYHNIVGDLKPERKEAIKHVLQAIADLQAGGAPLNEANIVDRYKSLSGKRIRGISGIAEEFEKGTFMSLQEIMENKPVDPEVERMKRGYAAKQFARVKPFLKSAWSDANPSAPPPMPTFGDMKSWTEHGSRPDWAGTTRLAVPKEVHDAVHKGADGKPKYPPAWMPIHMMPTWNYVMKKAGDDTPYEARNVNIQQGRLNLGNQASYQEGMVIASLRKYIQMRGGADQLTDIPSHKLSEVGLTHSDIFKAVKFADHDLSDAAIKKIMKHKILDPIALAPFIDKEVGGKKDTKKSFSLVVDTKLSEVSFRKSFVVRGEDAVKKAELISKIRAIRARG